jgi:hypothetical protein
MIDDEFIRSTLDELRQLADETKQELSGFRAESHRDLGSIHQYINDINVTQARQQIILEEHIRRTEANEQMVAMAKKQYDEDIRVLHTKISPIEKHVAMWGGAGKFWPLLVHWQALLQPCINYL